MRARVQYIGLYDALATEIFSKNCLNESILFARGRRPTGIQTENCCNQTCGITFVITMNYRLGYLHVALLCRYNGTYHPTTFTAVNKKHNVILARYTAVGLTFRRTPPLNLRWHVIVVDTMRVISLPRSICES